MTVTWKFPIPLPDGKGMEVENGNRVKKKIKGWKRLMETKEKLKENVKRK
jgi:hypothetical protein